MDFPLTCSLCLIPRTVPLSCTNAHRRAPHPLQMLMKDPHEFHLLLPALTSQGAWARPGRCHRASSHSSCQHCGSCALPGERHTHSWHTTLQSHQEHLWDHSPGLQSSLSPNQSLTLAAKPRGQEPATFRHRTQPRISPSGPVRSRRVRSPITGHSLLVPNLLPSFLLLHRSCSTNSSCSAPKRSSTFLSLQEPLTASPHCQSQLGPRLDRCHHHGDTPKAQPPGDCQQCIPKNTPNQPGTHLPGGVELVYVVHQVIRERREVRNAASAGKGHQDAQEGHGQPHLGHCTGHPTCSQIGAVLEPFPRRAQLQQLVGG